MALSKSASEMSPSWVRCAEQEKRSLPAWRGATVEKKGRQDSIQILCSPIEYPHFFHFQNNCKKRQNGKGGDILEENIT